MSSIISPEPIHLESFDGGNETRERYLAGSDVSPFTILDAEEIEMAEGYVNSGKSFLDMVRGKAEDPSLQHLPFKNYCFREFKYMQPNVALGNLFKELGQKAGKILFYKAVL